VLIITFQPGTESFILGHKISRAKELENIDKKFSVD
jgi:hypothetical protein